MSGLAAMIALASGQPGELCEDFLKELFRIIGDELEKGESVRIKGLGTFKVTEVDARKSVDVTTGEEIEIAPHRKVVFVASKELAALVNAPFEAFEAVEVSDALPTDELLDIAEEGDLESFTDVAEEVDSEAVVDEGDEVSDKLEIEETVGPVIISSDVLDTPEMESKNQDTESSTDAPVAELTEEVDAMDVADMENEKREAHVISFSNSATSGEPRRRNGRGKRGDGAHSANKEPIKTIHFATAEDDEEERVEPVRSRFGSGFLTGFLSAIALIAIVLLIGFKFDMVPDKVGNMLTKNSKVDAGANEEVTDAAAVLLDSVSTDSNPLAQGTSELTTPAAEPTQPGETSGDAVPTKASDEPVYDVVSTTRYLTTMAKEHYGNFNLWPIIYEENQSFLGHPDRIKPGTQVVIPPLSKYKVDPNNPEDVRRIKQKGVAIYAKYK